MKLVNCTGNFYQESRWNMYKIVIPILFVLQVEIVCLDVLFCLLMIEIGAWCE